MPRIRMLNKQKYGISKYRYNELRYFCMQYPEWKDELRYNTDTVKSKEITDMPMGGERHNQIEELAIRRVELQRKCNMIEEAAQEADNAIKDYIIKAVTNDGITFTYLQNIMGIPCGKTYFYEKRRKFYYILDKKSKSAVIGGQVNMVY